MTRAIEIVGVGIATIDIIQEVDAYPEEDSKIRALSSRKTRGGNVTNALAISAQLGCTCHWLGTTTDPSRDSDAAFVAENLGSFGISASSATILASGAMPVSYILASKATGSRTIIHHRDLPELSFENFCDGYNAIATRDNTSLWIHFEGRNLTNVEQMMEFLRDTKAPVTVSLEIEALRNDWEHTQRLLKLVDVAFVSKDYIKKKLDLRDAAAFFQHLEALWADDWRPRAIVCPWGQDGVYYKDLIAKSEHHIAATPIENAVDSVGAGDSFIGAALAGFAHGLGLQDALGLACRVATVKCTQQGFRLPVALRDDVLASLRK